MKVKNYLYQSKLIAFGGLGVSIFFYLNVYAILKKIQLHNLLIFEVNFTVK